MGTLDDAIREHLELKRRHGAGEDEIKEAEAAAFGSGELEVEEFPTTPDVPGASVTAPAGEGDQLDKVFAPAEPAAEPTPGEAEPQPESEVAEAEAMTVEAEAVEVVPAEPDTADDGDDAGDALEREREHLLGHPTENYDVDAAIAEEEELDLLSESRLSDELDRALGGPEEAPPAPPEPVVSEVEVVEEPAVVEPEESTAVVDEEIDGGVEVEVVEDDVEIIEEEVTETDLEPISEDPISEDPVEEGSDSGEIPLDDTPDFLEDTPDGEDLWFEQKEPKDFDFGD